MPATHTQIQIKYTVPHGKYGRSGQVRSGQVRSGMCTCTCRASCCSVSLSQAQVSAFAGSSVRDRKKKRGRGGRGKEIFYLTTHSTHFIYGYMASDISLRTIVRKETRCRHIGYSFRLTARVLLYAPSHRQDSTYHGLCYTSRINNIKGNCYIQEIIILQNF